VTKQPIAVLHVLYEALGEIEYPASSLREVEMMVTIPRGWPSPNRFYVEWLDQHNNREVFNCERGE